MKDEIKARTIYVNGEIFLIVRSYHPKKEKVCLVSRNGLEMNWMHCD